MKSASLFIRRGLVFFVLCLILVLAFPIGHLILTALHDQPQLTPPPAGYRDDVSRLNQTQVGEVVDVAPHLAQAVTQLRPLLAMARKNHLKVSLSGARHSMGGHTLYPGALVLNMLPLADMELNPATGILKVGAGCLWSQVIPFLDQRGRSVEVMQSDDNFSVGGSLSVNCHGWQPNHAPIASTVLAMTVMKADGTVVRCDRKNNRELFSLVLGGYGLFGIILEVELQTVPNELYQLESQSFPATQYAAEYAKQVDGNPSVGMAYGRLSVVPNHFLEEAVLNRYQRVTPQPASLPPLKPETEDWLKRVIFRGSVRNAFGKQLRWTLEKALGEHLAQKNETRNQLEYSDASFFMNRSKNQTDILHEYFVPLDRFPEMIEEMRQIIPKYQGDLLNVTVRQVLSDDDSFLAYARGERLALVLFFNQPMGTEYEAIMSAMTRELITAVLNLGGTYYLPYRLAATQGQFEEAYPMAQKFFQLKRKYDPDGLFQNEFYRKYGAVIKKK